MVSVIITTYKRPKFLIRAIESVIYQTYKDWEIIIIDDNDENSKYRKELKKILSIYKNNSKIKIIEHKKNMNGAVSRNDGIKIARGKYIAFLDDDDFYLPDRLKKTVEQMDKNDDYGFAYTGVYVMNNGKYCKKYEGDLLKSMLLQNSFLHTGSNLFFRMKDIKRINGFDETFLRHQDLEIMVRYLRNGKALFIDDILIVKDNCSRINEPKDIKKMFDNRVKFLNTFKDDINKYEDKEYILKYNYISVLKQALIIHDYKMAKKIKKELLSVSHITLKDSIVLFMCKYFYFLILLKRAFLNKMSKINLFFSREKYVLEINKILRSWR